MDNFIVLAMLAILVLLYAKSTCNPKVGNNNTQKVEDEQPVNKNANSNNNGMVGVTEGFTCTSCGV
jgi:hypothetical protein